MLPPRDTEPPRRRLRHFARHERAYPDGWFISTGVTPLGMPYAHAVHGSVIRRSYRWIFAKRRAAAFVLSRLQTRHRIRWHGGDWIDVDTL